MRLSEILLSPLFEANAPVDDRAITEAFWWVQRWVSGSLDDPDWEEDWLQSITSVNAAFPVVQQVIGNRRSVGKPLWRSLVLSRKAARQMEASKLLRPFGLPFASFTDSKRLAQRIGDDLQRPGAVHVIISASVTPECIMFGFKDLLASKLPAAQEAAMCLLDWEHQNEVVVRVNKVLPLLSVEVVETKQSSPPS